MNLIGRIGRRAIDSLLYAVDLTCFLRRAAAIWQPDRHVFNKAVYLIFLDQVILTGVNAMAIITFLAMFVGIAIASQLVFIIASVTEARDLVNILARLILSEIGPLVTGFVMIGRSCSATVVDLGNSKIHGEFESLRFMGIDIFDYFVVPRVLSMILSQTGLALYFSVVMLCCGMLSSTVFYDYALQSASDQLFSLVNMSSLLRFMLKNLWFGLMIGIIACFHGLAVETSPTQIFSQMQKAVVRSAVALFMIDGYFILFTL